MQPLSDGDLITKLQNGSLEALGMLYDRHQKLVYRTALAITTDPEAAADLLQDVFLRLFRFATHVDVARPIEPWLYRVTSNLAYTWLKRHRRWTHSLDEIVDRILDVGKSTIQNMPETDEHSHIVQQAIAALPINQRVVVVMHYINDLPLHEISEILEIPEGTVKSRLHYGRQVLKKYLAWEDEHLPELQYEFT